ncbi:antiviral reverse transcriptase Drt3a [Robbsia andropogonis]|uniref:antiviral reverse transcriptase Drt3a n=1 Tax=Robbsia andropogonis TaxID=28092 RepID=UPI003D2444A2
MYANEYSPRKLDALIQTDETSSFSALKKRHNRDDYLRRISAKVVGKTFQFENFAQVRIGQFRAYEPTRLGDRLVLRRLNNVLRRTYRVKQSDRTDIVRQAIKLLSEPTPKHVLKLDIKGFYESIDRNRLLDQLDQDQLLSDRSRWLLRQLFSTVDESVPKGLPRGINVSATLSEIVMRHIDLQIRQIEGVYFAARYVDDILLFCISDPNRIIQIISALLPDGMSLNAKKTKRIYVGCRCAECCVHAGANCPCVPNCACVPDPRLQRDLHYLGYRLRFNNVPSKEEKKKKEMQVRVGLAANKVSRYKSRVATAFQSNIRTPNFDLLEDRIRFLCENSRLMGPGLRGRLKTGIRFNYPLINDYEELKDLDQFLRSQLFARRNAHGARLSASLTDKQREILAVLSFQSGHKHYRSKIVHSSAFGQIKACWKHA